MLDFYETIINSIKYEHSYVIKLITKLLSQIDENNKMSTNLLYDELVKFDFNINLVSLNNLYKELPLYEFIILSYKDLDDHFNHILIDPTYKKFIKKGEASPLYFSAYPAQILQNINPNLLKNLINDKYSYIDDKNLQDYIRSFTNKPVNINLETIILDKYQNRKRVI